MFMPSRGPVGDASETGDLLHVSIVLGDGWHVEQEGGTKRVQPPRQLMTFRKRIERLRRYQSTKTGSALACVAFFFISSLLLAYDPRIDVGANYLSDSTIVAGYTSSGVITTIRPLRTAPNSTPNIDALLSIPISPALVESGPYAIYWIPGDPTAPQRIPRRTTDRQWIASETNDPGTSVSFIKPIAYHYDSASVMRVAIPWSDSWGVTNVVVMNTSFGNFAITPGNSYASFERMSTDCFDTLNGGVVCIDCWSGWWGTLCGGWYRA